MKRKITTTPTTRSIRRTSSSSSSSSSRIRSSRMPGRHVIVNTTFDRLSRRMQGLNYETGAPATIMTPNERRKRDQFRIDEYQRKKAEREERIQRANQQWEAPYKKINQSPTWMDYFCCCCYA